MAGREGLTIARMHRRVEYGDMDEAVNTHVHDIPLVRHCCFENEEWGQLWSGTCVLIACF